jgi:hypothetical protein
LHRLRLEPGVLGKVTPYGIGGIYEIILPRTRPPLGLLLAGDGSVHGIVHLEPDQTLDA